MNKFLSFVERHKFSLLAAAVVFSVAISLIHSFYFKIDPSVDANAYDDYAWSMATGHGYDNASSIGRPGPGYEFFLALIYYLFGHHYEAAWVFQAFLFGLTVLTAYFFAKILFEESWHPLIGLAAALFTGVAPDIVVLSSMLMTETLFIFLVTVFLFFFFKNYQSPRWFWLSWSALFLAFAILTRGNALFLILPALLFFVLERRWREGFIFLILFLVFMTPWTLRNYSVYGKFRPFNASPGLLWSGNYPGANGELNPKMPYPAGVDHEHMKQDEFDDALFRAGLQQIKSHPFEFLRLTLLRASIYFSAARPSAFWPYQEHRPHFKLFVTASASFHTFLIFVLGFLGAVISLKNFKSEAKKRLLYFLVFLLALPAAVLGLVVETRYRLPVYVLFSILSGYAVFWLATSAEKQKLKYLFFSASPVFLNTIFDVLRNLSRVLEKFR